MRYQRPDAFQMPAWAKDALAKADKGLEEALGLPVEKLLPAKIEDAPNVAQEQQKKRGWPKGKPRK